MINYDKISSRFFSCSLEEIKESAIVTNIRPIYSSLLQSGDVLFESHGFYSYATVRITGGLIFSLFGITPGNCVVDVVKLISQRSKHVFFLGIGGAIADDLSLGDVVEVTNFCSIDHQGKVLRRISSGVGRTIAQTDGLVQCEEYYYFLKQQHIDIVDMESADFSDTCQRLSLKYHYFIHISDIPLKIPFYDAESYPIVVKDFLYQVKKYVK